MKNFNLLISTSRFNETNAKAELWFTLLMCGDKYPIISNLEYSGLFTALSNLTGRVLIKKIKKILIDNPKFFQYIIKIIPIDFICETSVKFIIEFIENNYPKFLIADNTFKIDLIRRKSQIIERDVLIEAVAKKIENRVDLDNPDITIRIELLGNVSGISFLSPEDIIRTDVHYA